MMLRKSAVMLVIVISASVWGQSSPGPLAGRRQTVMATSNADGMAAASRARAAANQNMQEMGETLSKMHVVLKEMSAKTASNSRDSIAKANLEMWTLMVGQLDKQYEQLRVAVRQREDLEARRAAMYKQADEKAAEAAKKAREGAKAASADSSSPSQPPAPGQTPATPATSSTSPN